MAKQAKFTFISAFRWAVQVSKNTLTNCPPQTNNFFEQTDTLLKLTNPFHQLRRLQIMYNQLLGYKSMIQALEWGGGIILCIRHSQDYTIIKYEYSQCVWSGGQDHTPGLIPWLSEYCMLRTSLLGKSLYKWSAPQHFLLCDHNQQR